MYPENALPLHDLIISCIRSGEILILPYYICFINSKSIFLLIGGKFAIMDIQMQLTKWNWMAANAMVWCKRRNTVLLLQSRYGLEGRKWNRSLTSEAHICLRNVTVLGKLAPKLLMFWLHIRNSASVDKLISYVCLPASTMKLGLHLWSLG